MCVFTVTRPGTQIIFTLQGETGKSVSQYSKQWLGLVSTVKGWIRAGKSLRPSDVLVSGGAACGENRLRGEVCRRTS